MTPALRIMHEGEIPQCDARAALARSHALASLSQQLLNRCELAIAALERAGQRVAAAQHQDALDKLMLAHEKGGR